MDIATALIALICFVALCLFGYLLVAYGINRKSYDDVVAERKEKWKEEMQATNKEKKEKKEKKKSNKKEKKERAKESNQPVHPRVGFSEQPVLLNEDTKVLTEEAPVVQEEVELEVTEVPEVKTRPESKASKKKKEPQESSKQKPKHNEEATKTKTKSDEQKPKQNKKEAKPVEEEEPKVTKKERTSSLKEQTEEAVKLPQQKHKKETHNKQQAKTEPTKEPAHEVELEKEVEKLVVQESSSTSPSPPPTEQTSQRQSRKSKKQKLPKDLEDISDQLTSHVLAQILRSCNLDHNEIQMLIDTLLNKQNSASNQWIERGQQRVENIAELKKKLEESEAVSQNNKSKVLELRAELNSEKSRSSQRDKQLKDALNEKQNEIQVVHTTMKRTNEKLNAQINQLKAQLQVHATGKKSTEDTLSRLSEENQQLKALVEQAQLRVQQQEASKQEIEAVYQKQMQAMGMELKQSQERSSLLAMKEEEANRLREENERLAAQVASVQMRPQADGQEEPGQQEMEKKMEEEELNTIRMELQEKQTHIVHLSEQLQHRDQMVLELQSRLSTAEGSQQAVERLQGELEESVLKLKELENATSQLQHRDADISRLNSELDSLKGSAREKASELQKAEEGLSEKTQQVENLSKQVTELKEQVEQRLEADVSQAKTGEVSGLVNDDRVEKLQKELEERNKHLDVLTNDTLKQKDKQIEDLRLQVQTTQEESSTKVREEQARSKEAMQRLCPHIVLEDSDYSCWLNNYVVAVSKELGEASTSELTHGKLEERVGELEEKLQENHLQNERLAKEVNHYRTVLTETESMLSSLQGSVDSAEQDWKVQVEQLREEKKQLEAKLEATKELQAAQEAASEMQEKLVELQKKLQGEEEEKKELATKYNEVHHACEDLRQQVDEQLERTRQITEELESVRKSHSDLQKEKVKLSSLVNIGEAALKEEQETVKRLQKELSVTKGATVNGSNVEQLTNGQPHEQTSEVEESNKV